MLFEASVLVERISFALIELGEDFSPKTYESSDANILPYILFLRLLAYFFNVRFSRKKWRFQGLKMETQCSDFFTTGHQILDLIQDHRIAFFILFKRDKIDHSIIIIQL